MLPSVGLVDGMRVTEDTWGKDVRATEAMAARWFMHNNFWLNDPDAIVTRDVSIPQAQAWATLMAVTGGVQTIGDNLLTLDSARLEIVKKIHPVMGESDGLSICLNGPTVRRGTCHSPRRLTNGTCWLCLIGNRRTDPHAPFRSGQADEISRALLSL